MADESKTQESNPCDHDSAFILIRHNQKRKDQCSYCNVPVASANLHHCQDCNLHICDNCIKLEPKKRFNYYHACKIFCNIEKNEYVEFLENVSVAALSTASHLNQQKLGLSDGSELTLDIGIISDDWYDGNSGLSLLMAAIKYKHPKMIHILLKNHVK